MSRSTHERLRVGVIGLGRLWEGRHRPALARLAQECDLVAIYDQVARRATIEAEACGCVALDGLREIVERVDLDAIYFLAPQWFAWQGVELAAKTGAAIYSALPLASDPAGFLEIASQLRAREAPFVPELARRFYPATIRLMELLASRLGAPRLIVGHARFFDYDRYGPPGPSTQLAPLPMTVDPGLNLLDWCSFVVGAEPEGVQGFGAVAIDSGGSRETPATEDYGGFTLDFPGGALAQVSYSRYHRAAWGDATSFLPAPGFQVYAERGVAWLEMPDRIQWTDSEGMHEAKLPLEPALGVTLTDHFFRALRNEQSLSPTLDDAVAAVRLSQALERSRQEGRRIDPRALAK